MTYGPLPTAYFLLLAISYLMPDAHYPIYDTLPTTDCSLLNYLLHIQPTTYYLRPTIYIRRLTTYNEECKGVSSLFDFADESCGALRQQR